MTHEESKERRLKIVEYYETFGLQPTLRYFDCSLALVRSALRERGVSMTTKTMSPDRLYRVIAELINNDGSTQQEIAERCDVTAQYVSQIKQKCREHGII